MRNPIKSGSFLAQTLDLISGTAFAQIILIGSSPILTRLFPPEAFGIAATYTSLVAVFGIASCLRYELAIVIPESDKDAAKLFLSCLLLSFFVSALCGLMTFVAVATGYPGPIVQALGNYIWFIPIALLVNGFHLAINHWNIRQGRFRKISMGKVLTQSTNTGVALGTGWYGFATGGILIVCNFLGHATNLLFLVASMRKLDWTLFRTASGAGRLGQSLRQYRNFPIYSLPSGLFNTLSAFLPILGLGLFFTPAIVGFYAFTMRILLAPISLLGGALSQVLTLRLARARKEEGISQLFENVFKALLSIAIFPMVFLMFMGGDIFTIAFGIKWELAGVFSQIIAPWTMLWFITSPLSVLFEVCEKQKLGTYSQLAILSSRILAMGLGAISRSAEITIMLLSLFGILALLFMLGNLSRIAGVPWIRLARGTLVWVAFAIILAALIALFEFISPNNWTTLSVSVLITAFFTIIGIFKSGFLKMRDMES